MRCFIHVCLQQLFFWSKKCDVSRLFIGKLIVKISHVFYYFNFYSDLKFKKKYIYILTVFCQCNTSKSNTMSLSGII